MNQYYRISGLILVTLLSGCASRQYEAFQPNTEKKSYKEKEKIVSEIKKERNGQQIKEVGYEQACKLKKHYLAIRRHDLVEKSLERMIQLADNYEAIGNHTLELADLYVGQGFLDKAEKLYAHYCENYPGNERHKYASYQHILSKFWRILNAHNDQTATQDTIRLAKQFLQEFPEEDAYRTSVKETLHVCYNTILEREKNTMQFYLHRYEYNNNPTALTAAHQRLAYIQKEILPELMDQAPELHALEMKLAQVLETTKNVADIQSPALSYDEKLQKDRLLQAELLQSVAQELEHTLSSNKTITLASR